MEHRKYFILGDIDLSPDFYVNLRSTRYFYVIPYTTSVVYVSPRDLKVTNIFTEDEVLVGHSLYSELLKLKERCDYDFIGFLKNDVENPEFYKQSIYVKQDQDFDLHQHLHIFDVCLLDKIYDQRLEIVKLLLNLQEFNYIIPSKYFPVHFTHRDTPVSIWNRFFMFLDSLGSFLLRPFDHELTATPEVIIYNDYLYKTVVVVNKKQNNKDYYLICKAGNSYFRLFSGLTFQDFKAINKNDRLVVATRPNFISPVFVNKITN